MSSPACTFLMLQKQDQTEDFVPASVAIEKKSRALTTEAQRSTEFSVGPLLLRASVVKAFSS